MRNISANGPPMAVDTARKSPARDLSKIIKPRNAIIFMMSSMLELLIEAWDSSPLR